ncbi:hypothetical protein HOT75_gp113 [Gordonia phage Daredevil]|uniref:dATP/dGTP diphosphohydrolase N-terminal domain-containing protein n=1 Tax=Gordonia phage Daredevil TaxID=2283286 RepID=A0A345MIW9_9CAUD|nr:hypothetical protein HOT75_gp113 [Gordonia phage Daredevil]AXH70500.1 hypothetical protein SEA_DAREDEVIL_113 [Gordonia phage Daredevil]
MSTLTTEEIRQTSSTGAEKGQKIQRVDLLPVRPLLKVAEHYGVGAKKYAERNWEAGYSWSLSYQSLMRHALQFWAGEDIDEETGTPHMAAVVFHALALMEFMETHREFDNRPSTTEAQRQAAELAQAIEHAGMLWSLPDEPTKIEFDTYTPEPVDPDPTWTDLDDVPTSVGYVIDQDGDYWRRDEDDIWTANTTTTPLQPSFWHPWSWSIPKRPPIIESLRAADMSDQRFQVAEQLARTSAGRMRP